MKLIIKTLSGKTLNVEVDDGPNTTTDALRAKIQEQEGSVAVYPQLLASPFLGFYVVLCRVDFNQRHDFFAVGLWMTAAPNPTGKNIAPKRFF
jgi:hypothetical protein